MLGRIGTRTVIVAGCTTVSRIPVRSFYLADVFPALMMVSLGIGAVFVAITPAANAGVPRQVGLVAALLSAHQQLGAAGRRGRRRAGVRRDRSG
jgi:hypothetical protein